MTAVNINQLNHGYRRLKPLVTQARAAYRRVHSGARMTQLSEDRRDRMSCNRLHTHMFALSGLLIRGAARFVIRMQQLAILLSANWRELILEAVGTGRKLWAVVIGTALLTGFGMGWLSGFVSDRFFDVSGHSINKEAWMQTVVGRIITVESNGDQKAKNNRSSAMGAGQFLDQTWLELIRAYRPDLMTGRSQGAILELRQDGRIAREITGVFMEKNAAILQKRGLPVTPATLYLAHFAGPAGAVAILSALENADAASVMASADATGRTTRETIVKANPFLQNFTVADLRSWADRKMRFSGS
jgi:hypothetical protein